MLLLIPMSVAHQLEEAMYKSALFTLPFQERKEGSPAPALYTEGKVVDRRAPSFLWAPPAGCGYPGTTLFFVTSADAGHRDAASPAQD